MNDFYSSDINPISIVRRKGDSIDPFVSITETIKIADSGKVILKEIPSKFDRVIAKDSEDIQLFEVLSSINLSFKSFYVDYSMGIVIFSDSQIGKNITFTYKGTGVIAIGASRIYVEDDGLIATRTLREMIEANENILVSGEVLDGKLQEATAKLLEINTTKTEVDLAVENVREINTIIDNANTAIEETNKIINATKFIEEYKSSTSYLKNNIVRYEGSSFMAIQDTIGNTPPTLPIKDNQWWALQSQRGVNGNGAVDTINNISPDINGNIDVEIPEQNDATTSVKGIVILSNDIDSTDETKAVTPLALKTLKDNLSITNVKDFGAKGDGVTDDTTAIENAITYASQKQATGKKVKLLFAGDSKEYKSTRTITIPANIDVEMLAPIVYKGNVNEPCLVIGQTDASTTGVYRLSVNRGNRSDWTSENCIGIVLINADTSDIHVELARNFTIGVQCLGSDGGWAYNTTKLGAINNNKIGLDLTSELGGWANENLFLGGRFSVDSVVHVDKDRIGVRIWGKDGTYDYYNNNVFEKPSFEISSNPDIGVALPILIEDGFSNKFNSIRSEGDYPYTIITKNDAHKNYVEVGYGVAEILNEGNRGNNYCYHYGQENLSVTYAFENLHKKANQYDATQIYVPNVAFDWGTDSQSMISGVSIQSNCLQFTSSRRMNVVVDTSIRKQFIIHRDVLTGFGGRIYIRCYDVNGNILTEANALPAWKYAKGSGTFYFYTSSNSYETGGDSEEPLELSVSEEVKKIAVIFTRGTNDLKIRGFSITSLDGATSVYSEAPEFLEGAKMAVMAPTLGTYKKGTFIYNANPTELGTVGSKYIVTGWTCMTTGTSGTWVQNRSLTGN